MNILIGGFHTTVVSLPPPSRLIPFTMPKSMSSEANSRRATPARHDKIFPIVYGVLSGSLTMIPAFAINANNHQTTVCIVSDGLTRRHNVGKLEPRLLKKRGGGGRGQKNKC